MPPHPSFSGRTPEALIGRNDSKNPSTTCKGITGSGRPCRRALAAPNKRQSGVVRLEEDDDQVTGAEFYCWQHKDQAQRAEGCAQDGKTTELFPLQERNSVDTLVQRLGVEGVGSDLGSRIGGRKPKREEKGRQDGEQPSRRHAAGSPVPPRRNEKKGGFWPLLCCVHEEEDDYEIVRRRRRTSGSAPQRQSCRPHSPETVKPQISSTRPPRTRPTDLPIRPLSNHRPSSTSNLLSLIPPTLSPQTASALLAELSKPPNPKDEDGYIYIFWLTPQAKATPSGPTARSLLDPPAPSADRTRRISDVVSEYSVGDEGEWSTGGLKPQAKKTILLKIGRANNVTRRMNEWQRQCGYTLTLVRWYPYVSSSAAPSPVPSPARTPNQQSAQPQLYPDLSKLSPSGEKSPTSRRESGTGVRKVPCVKRVERLIHLELAARQVKSECAVCGREHREWFAVDASENGVKRVDEVVRRWVGWGEKQV